MGRWQLECTLPRLIVVQWDLDPLEISNLTHSILANLQSYDPTANSVPKLRNKFRPLPQELQDQITSYLTDQPLALGCNYVLSQSCWKKAFISIPFLWDLDAALVSKKSLQHSKGAEWDWEKLTRQLMNRVDVVIEAGKGPITWSYKKLGLDVPSGLNNRRRIWQIVEDMYPNDVGHVHLSLGDESDSESDSGNDESV